MTNVCVAKEGRNRSITRRRALKVLAGAGATVLSISSIWRRAGGSQSIVVADPGGPFTKAFEEAFHKPFMKATSIEAIGLARRHAPSAQVKAMVESRSYTWDVIYLAIADASLLYAGGFLDLIDTTGSDSAEIPDNMKTNYFSGNDVYAVTIAYRTDKYGNKGPRTWADVWDVKKFPGRRSLRKTGYDTAEQALLADGVAPGPEIYRILSTRKGWDRVFRKLDDIKPHVNIWWEGGALATQALSTGEVDILAGFNARHQATIDGGAPVAISWEQGFYSIGGWSIAKGNPKADLARQYIKFVANAKLQAAFTPYLAYGPTNPNAYKHIDPKRAKALPTAPENFRSMFQIDHEFWRVHRAEAAERFNEWLLRG